MRLAGRGHLVSFESRLVWTKVCLCRQIHSREITQHKGFRIMQWCTFHHHGSAHLSFGQSTCGDEKCTIQIYQNTSSDVCAREVTEPPFSPFYNFAHDTPLQSSSSTVTVTMWNIQAVKPSKINFRDVHHLHVILTTSCAYRTAPSVMQPPEGQPDQPPDPNHGRSTPRSVTATYIKIFHLPNRLRKSARHAAASTWSIASLDLISEGE